MQNTTLKGKLIKQLAIISLSFLLLILIVVFVANIGLRSSIAHLVYLPKAHESASKISSYYQRAQEKANLIKKFSEEEITNKGTIDANILKQFLSSIHSPNDIFQSFGVYIKSIDLMSDTIGLSSFIVNKAFSIQSNDTYWGPKSITPIKDYQLAKKNIAYNSVLNTGEKKLVLPYFNPDFEDIKVFSSYLLPLKKNQEVIGFVKVDYNFSDFKLKKILGKTDFFSMQIISSNGIVAYNSNGYFEGRPLKEFEKNFESHLIAIQSNKTSTEILGNQIKIALPLSISKDADNWQLILRWQNPAFIQLLKSRFLLAFFLISGSILLLTLIFAFILTKSLTPFKTIVSIAKKLEKGDLDIKEEKLSGQEFSVIQHSFYQIIRNLRNLSQIAQQIGEVNYSVEYKILSEKDVLGKAIVKMNKQLEEFFTEEQKLKIEAQNRVWISEGLAKFSVKLKNTDLNISEIFTHFLPELTDYIGAVQATIFKMQKKGANEDDWELNLISAYAYHQNKYLERNLKIGEGLVGMCAKEKKSYLIKDVPENYLFIKSGFGATSPKNIFILPLIFNEIVYGVLEIASLDEFIEFKTDFLEQLSENIAGTIAAMENSEMSNLLLEKTKKQAQELQSREEELRQNLEELQATQEKYQNNLSEMKSYVRAMEQADLLIEFNRVGDIIYFNNRFADFLDMEKEQVSSLSLDNIVGAHSEEYKQLYKEINLGRVFQFSGFIQNNEQNKYFSATFAPVMDAAKNLIKIIAIGKDTTELENLRTKNSI